MFKKTITCKDFNDVDITQDYYFHFTEAELTEMNLSHEGGMEAYIQRIINTRNTPELIKLFKDLVLKAYGVKSDDGTMFMKNDEIRAKFAATNAYSTLFMELVNDDKAAAEFIKQCLPRDIRKAAESSAVTDLTKS